MSDIQCPDAGTWKTFLDGDVLDDAAAKLAAHLEDCETCQQTLERLAAGKETWEGTAKQLADADTANAEAGIGSSGHLQGVLDDLKQGIDVGPAATTSSRDVLRFLEPSDEPGSIGRLDSYEILEVVGAGGMGVVLRGWDPTLRRVVAIKVLAAHLANSAAAERRFVREAQAAAAVSHDHVVAIHAVGAGHEPPYLVMQFVEGKTLQQRLDRTGPLNVNELLRIGQQTALGLAAAHRQGIVHRDIKPANILLENGVERVRITDFGLARAIDDASMTQSGVVAGTPLFMAPEQAQGHPVDHRSDLFSLGSVLYAMATGRPPFRSSTMMGVIRRVCDDQPRPIREINPDIPDWLCGIIYRLLAKNPAERFQTADEVAELLAGCLAHVQHPLSVPLPVKADESAELSRQRGSHVTSTTGSSGLTFASNVATAAADVTRDWETPVSMPPAPQVYGTPEHVETVAMRLVKWPAICLFLVGLANGAMAIVATLYNMQRMTELGSSDTSFIQANLILLLPAGLCMMGALRLGSLKSRVWANVGVIAGMISGPLFVLGLPVGIWVLSRMKRPEVARAFEYRQGTEDDRGALANDVPWPESPSVGQILARFALLMSAFLIAITAPFLLPVLAAQGGPAENWGTPKLLLGVCAVIAVIGGLVGLYKYAYRLRHDVQSDGSQPGSSDRPANDEHGHGGPDALSAKPLPFGMELTRLLILGLMWVLAIAIPLVSYVLAQDSGAFPDVGFSEKTMLGLAALAVVFGLAATLKHLERRRKAASGRIEIRSTIARQIRRVPEVLVCSMLGVFTMQAIYADLTALHYDRFMESVIIPLFCVTLATLGIVVFINRRRIRELKASGQEDPELNSAYRTAIVIPTGLLVPIIVLLALWGHRQSIVGYVAFDVDNPMSIVSFRNVETDKAHTLSASWKRIRLPAGTYEWSVSEGPIQNMVIDSGTIEVQPRVGQLLSARIDKAEALRLLAGKWKYQSGNVKWDGDQDELPDWARTPEKIDFQWRAGMGKFGFVFYARDSGQKVIADVYLCDARADLSPKQISLFKQIPELPHEDWPCVAQGYWQIGQNGLYLILGPAGELRLPNTYSVPTDRYARYQFERVLEDQVPDEESLENPVGAIRRSEAELQRRIQLGLVSAEVLAVQQARAGGHLYVEVGTGSDDGFREGDDLAVFRKNPDGKDEYIATIRLTLLHPDRAVGLVIEKAKGKSVEVGDGARLGDHLATNGIGGRAADDPPPINLFGEDPFPAGVPPQDSQ